MMDPATPDAAATKPDTAAGKSAKKKGGGKRPRAKDHPTAQKVTQISSDIDHSCEVMLLACQRVTESAQQLIEAVDLYLDATKADPRTQRKLRRRAERTQEALHQVALAVTHSAQQAKRANRAWQRPPAAK